MNFLLRKPILCFILPILFCACKSQQRQSEQLIGRAAALLETAPDSSLQILSDIQPQTLDQRYRSRYAVLSIRAKEKTGGDISSDTAAFAARDYLMKEKDNYAALAGFVAASVYEAQGKDDQALYNYLLAADRPTDNRLNALLSYNIGRIYYLNQLHKESLPYSKKALAYEVSLGVTGESLCYTLELIAVDYIYLSETDSSLIFSNKALELAEQESTRYRLAFAVATAYHKASVYTFARSKYRQALSYTDDNTGKGKCYLGLAGVYAAMEQPDSAHWYIRKAIPVIEGSNNYADMQEMYRIRYILEEDQRDKAFYLRMYKLFPALKDYYDNSPILRARERYKNDVIRQREEERDRIVLQRKMYFLIILNLVLVSFIGVYFLRRHLYRTKYEHRRESHFLQYKLEKEQQASDKKFDELRQQHEEEQQRLQEVIETQQRRSEEQQQDLLNQWENERKYYEGEIERIKREHDREMTTVKRVANDDRFKMLFNTEELAELYRAVHDMNYKVAVPNEIRDQFKRVLKKYSWDELFPIINNAVDGLLDRIRADFPELKEQEYRVCCLSYIGLRAQAISFILGGNLGTTRNRRSSVRKAFGLGLRDNIHNYLSAYYGIPDELHEEDDDDDDIPENQ